MSGFGGVIKLTGEKDYINALKRIRQSLRETASSLSAISSSFKNNARDMDITRQAASKLKDVLKKQSDDANSLRSAYEKMQKIFENNRKEIEKLQRSYESARKELEKIEKEAGKTSDAYKKQAEEVKKLEQNLEKETKKQRDNEVALSKMRTELNNSQTALSKTKDEINKVEDSLKKSVETTKKANTEYGKLKSTIEKQGEALSKLKSEYKEVVIKEGDASEAAKKLAGQIKDLSGKLEENKTKLKNVDDAAEKVAGGLKNVGDSAGKSSKGVSTFKIALGNFVSNIALRAIDKLKELAVETFNVGRAFEYSMSKVKAISGANEGEFTNLRNQAIELGKGTIFSARESAEAMKYMAIAGWRTNEILAGLRPTLDLAAASGEDLAQVSDILTDGMTAFGMSAQEAGRFADVLATAAINSNTDVGKMGDTFKYVAPIANALGYSIEDTAIAIGTMADSSIKASQAGTDLRSIFNRLATNAGASKNQLGALDVLTKKLGVAFYDSSGKTRPFVDVLRAAREAWKKLSQEEQVNYANTIAGQRAMAGWLTLMNTAPEKFNQVTDSIKNSSGTAQRVAKQMTDNVEGDVKRLKGRVEGAQINLAKAFEPETRGTLGWLKGAADILQYIADHSVAFKTALVTIGSGVTAFIAATQGSTIVTTIVTALTSALEGLWAVLAANPIGAVVASVAGLAAGFIYLWNTSEGFKNFWIDLWKSMKESLGKIGGFFSELFGGIGKGSEKVYSEMDKRREEDRRKNEESLEKTGKFFSDFFKGIGKGSEKVYSEMDKTREEYIRRNKESLEKTGKFFSEFFEKVKKGAREAWEKIKEVFSGWGKFFGELWDKVKTKFSELGTKIGNAVGSAVKSGINYVINLLEDKINSAIRLINGAISLINAIPGVNINRVDYLRLPRLAKGGVLDNGARTVIAGEDGAEAIVPLEKNTKWISLVANQLQKQMMPSLNSNANVQSSMRVQDEFNSLVNSFKQALSEMKVVMDEETFGKFVDRTVSDAIYD